MTETAPPPPDPPRERNVLVAGAINTDLVARVRVAPAAGETVLGESFAVFGGGKAANQAVAAARSGAPTAMLGALGGDDFGRQRLADLRAEGIDVAAVAVLDGVSSGVALILVEEASGQNRIANVLGATARVAPAQAARVVERLRPAVLLLTLEFPRETVAALVEAARGVGASVLLNATPNPTAGRALLPSVDLLIVNETEAGDLLGRPVAEGEGAAAAQELAKLGPGAVVVTLGAAGAVVARGGETTAIPAPAVEVVDTTGAGDAFCGALAARLVGGADPVAAARRGVVAGSLAATKAGAQPSMPRRDEIERLAARHPSV
jgi:ribokinase